MSLPPSPLSKLLNNGDYGKLPGGSDSGAGMPVNADGPAGGIQIQYQIGPDGRVFPYYIDPQTGDPVFLSAYNDRVDGSGASAADAASLARSRDFNDRLNAAKDPASLYLQAQSLADAQQQGEGTLANDVLKNLETLRENPAAGPLGLAAFGAFGGGAQNAAAATGGAGLTNPYGGAFDRALSGVMSGVFGNPNSIYNPDNNGKVDTQAQMIKGAFGSGYDPATGQFTLPNDSTFSDPNKAPAPSPASAAAGDNQAVDWIKAWEAYHPGQQFGATAAAPAAPATPALADGGVVPTATPTPSPSAPVPSPVPSAPAPAPSTPSTPAAPAPDPYAAYGGKALVDAMHTYMKQGGSPDKFVGTLRDIADLNSRIQAGKIPVAVPSAPILGQPVKAPDITTFAPGYIKSLLNTYKSSLPYQGDFADGGGVTVGGQPHYIVDGQGNVKANITEDGQPEHVAGIPGGVEVTPMNPVRQAAYESAKNWSRVLADLDAKIGAASPANMATGGQYLFPSIPTSLVNTGPGNQGTNELPTAGGPSTPRSTQVGNYFKSTYDPTTGKFTLPSEATDNTTANDNAGYAKLLGGALSSGNTAINIDALRSLNAGKVPDKLLSAQELGTMAPSQRAGYYGLLQSALGVTPQDAQAMIKRFTPTSFTA